MLKKIYNNLAINTWAAQIVNLGYPIFVLPLLLINFESSDVSLWFYLNIIIGFGQLADFGFGSNLVRSVSQFYNGSKEILDRNTKIDRINSGINYKGLNSLYFTSRKIYYFLVLFVVIVLPFLSYLLSKNLIMLSTNETIGNISFLFSCLITMFMIFNIHHISFIQGLGKVIQLKRFDTFLGFLKVLLLFFVLVFAPRLDLLFLVLFIIQLIKYFWVNFFLARINKEINFHPKPEKFDSKIFRKLYKPSYKTAVINIGAYLINYSSAIVVGQLNNSSLSANYLLTHKILNFIYNISINPIYSKIPDFSGYLVRNEIERLFKSFTSYLVLGSLIFIFSSTIIILFGNSLISIFISESSTKFVDKSILIIIAITLLLEFIHSSYSTLYMLNNDVPFMWPAIISGALIIIFSAYLVEPYGVLAIVLTPFLIQLSFNNWFPIYMVIKYYKTNPIKYFFDKFKF